MGAQINIGFLKYFENDWSLLTDLLDFTFGGNLGTGSARAVYTLKDNEKYCIKLDFGGHFDNVVEWEIWNNLQKHPEIGKFLCPCISISPGGKFLIQQKTIPVTLDEMPKMIPDCFTDTKIENWGRIGKRIVCHDYANHKFMNGDKHKMVKVDWWSLNYQVLPKKVQDVIDNLKEEKNNIK